ncbi:hypothetical protein EH151_12660 [Elizabethkingia anophelis]|uniref:DUF7296 family protein n=1 Tax=Elizabethkingia TaxID=308865 RepID=UPI000750D478|nr:MULTISPECIES: hypothetical protein [Elizabethkingia]KUY28045.1 hypothetical protein ATB96_19610 [Elizabethkingia ursingii]MYZ60738.1 hypothetical protein [Elizabethkingia anophelis]
MEAKFYTYSQNNSGGYFVKDEMHGICETVIIQAENEEKAWAKLNEIGDNVSGMWNYCECCGERWSNYVSDETDEPMLYGEKVEEATKGMFRNACYVHYLDGTFKEFILK